MDMFIVTYNGIVWQTEKIRQRQPAFKDKSGDSKQVVIARRRLMLNFICTTMLRRFGVCFDIVDPIVGL